jgi:hypothetical protein
MTSRTTMDQAPVLGLPAAEPIAPADCGVCQALAQQRTEARKSGDLSRVSDRNVEIRNHHDLPVGRRA